MQTKNKGRTTISILGLTLSVLLTIGLIAVGINRIDPGQSNESSSPRVVATMHHPTDRGPGHGIGASDTVAAPSSRIGFDRDVATNHLAQRAWRTAVADAGTDQHAPMRRGKTTTAPEARDGSGQIEGFRER